MKDQINESCESDEVNLFNYWKVIFKRRRLLLGVFLAVSIGTLVVNLLMPKVYRGEYMVYMASHDYANLLERINSNDKNRLKDILPRTYLLIDEVELTPFPDTILYKLKIIIDARDTGNIGLIKDELFECLISFPSYKKSVALKVERLQKELSELSRGIAYTEEILKTYNELLKGEKQVPAVFNPVELHNGMAELIRRKVLTEQWLQNYSPLEVVTEEIHSHPVRPVIKRNVLLSALAGILAGIFFAFIAEFAERVGRPAVKEPEE